MDSNIPITGSKKRVSQVRSPMLPYQPENSSDRLVQFSQYPPTAVADQLIQTETVRQFTKGDKHHFQSDSQIDLYPYAHRGNQTKLDNIINNGIFFEYLNSTFNSKSKSSLSQNTLGKQISPESFRQNSFAATTIGVATSNSPVSQSTPQQIVSSFANPVKYPSAKLKKQSSANKSHLKHQNVLSDRYGKIGGHHKNSESYSMMEYLFNGIPSTALRTQNSQIPNNFVSNEFINQDNLSIQPIEKTIKSSKKYRNYSNQNVNAGDLVYQQSAKSLINNQPQTYDTSQQLKENLPLKKCESSKLRLRYNNNNDDEIQNQQVSRTNNSNSEEQKARLQGERSGQIFTQNKQSQLTNQQTLNNQALSESRLKNFSKFLQIFSKQAQITEPNPSSIITPSPSVDILLKFKNHVDIQKEASSNLQQKQQMYSTNKLKSKEQVRASRKQYEQSMMQQQQSQQYLLHTKSKGEYIDQNIREFQFGLSRSSSSNSKEPNRRYEVTQVGGEKYSEINQKIKGYLDSRKQNSSRGHKQHFLSADSPSYFPSIKPQMSDMDSNHSVNRLGTADTYEEDPYNDTENNSLKKQAPHSFNTSFQPKNINNSNKILSPVFINSFTCQSPQAKSVSHKLIQDVTPATNDEKRIFTTQKDEEKYQFVEIVDEDINEDISVVAVNDQGHQRTPVDNIQQERNQRTQGSLNYRMNILETEMSTVIKRCMNLEESNNQLAENIIKITKERDYILVENKEFKRQIEELSNINKKQEDTLKVLIKQCKIRRRDFFLPQSAPSDASISELITNRSEISNQYLFTDISTVEGSNQMDSQGCSLTRQQGHSLKSSTAIGTDPSSINYYPHKGHEKENVDFSNFLTNAHHLHKNSPLTTFSGYLNSKQRIEATKSNLLLFDQTKRSKVTAIDEYLNSNNFDYQLSSRYGSTDQNDPSQ